MSHTYQNQCVFCSFQRVEIQLIPCGHFYHVKCIYPWPTRTCQNCNCNINEVKVIQPCYHKFVTLPPAIQSYRYHNLEELQSFGVLRRGRWSSEELAYGNLLRDLFCSNSLPLTNETRSDNRPSRICPLIRFEAFHPALALSATLFAAYCYQID